MTHSGGTNETRVHTESDVKVFVAQASKQAFSCTWSNNGPLANVSLYELGALRSFLQTVRNVGDHDRRLFLER